MFIPVVVPCMSLPSFRAVRSPLVVCAFGLLSRSTSFAPLARGRSPCVPCRVMALDVMSRCRHGPGRKTTPCQTGRRPKGKGLTQGESARSKPSRHETSTAARQLRRKTHLLCTGACETENEHTELQESPGARAGRVRTMAALRAVAGRADRGAVNIDTVNRSRPPPAPRPPPSHVQRARRWRRNAPPPANGCLPTTTSCCSTHNDQTSSASQRLEVGLEPA